MKRDDIVRVHRIPGINTEEYPLMGRVTVSEYHGVCQIRVIGNNKKDFQPSFTVYTAYLEKA